MAQIHGLHFQGCTRQSPRRLNGMSAVPAAEWFRVKLKLRELSPQVVWCSFLRVVKRTVPGGAVTFEDVEDGTRVTLT